MKILKTIAVLAALSMASSAFAEVKVKAFNKLSSDIVELDHSGDETTNTFPGFKNKIKAEILTDHLDAMVEGVFKITDFTNENDYVVAWDGAVSDWYVEARVLDDLLTLGYHDNINPEGTYLPIYDDNVGTGNIGSDGFTLVLRPVEGLRLGFSVPFTDDTSLVTYDVETGTVGVNEDFGGNILVMDGETKEGCPDIWKYPNLRLGAIYDMGIAEFGVAAHDFLDSKQRSIGFYVYSAGLFGQVKGIDFRAGFAHSWGKVALGDKPFYKGKDIEGENFWNVSFEISEIIPFSLAVEAAGNTNSDDSAYDFYTGLKLGFGINEQLSLDVIAGAELDLSDENAKKAMLHGKAALDYNVTKLDTVEVAVDYNKCDEKWNMKFPVSWKHKF